MVFVTEFNLAKSSCWICSNTHPSLDGAILCVGAVSRSTRSICQAYFNIYPTSDAKYKVVWETEKIQFFHRICIYLFRSVECITEGSVSHFVANICF